MDRLITQALRKQSMEAVVSSIAYIPANLLLYQAERASQAHLYEGSALLCRAAVEQAMYAFLCAKASLENPAQPLTLDSPRCLDGRIRDVAFEELRKGVSAKRVLSQEEQTALSDIQLHGNETAHTLGFFAKALAKLEAGDKSAYERYVKTDPKVAEDDVRNARGIIRTLEAALSKRLSLELAGRNR